MNFLFCNYSMFCPAKKSPSRDNLSSFNQPLIQTYKPFKFSSYRVSHETWQSSDDLEVVFYVWNCLRHSFGKVIFEETLFNYRPQNFVLSDIQRISCWLVLFNKLKFKLNFWYLKLKVILKAQKRAVHFLKFQD